VGLDPVYTDPKNPDFGEVAKVMGIWGRSVSKSDGLYTDRKPANSVLINGWVREGIRTRRPHVFPRRSRRRNECLSSFKAAQRVSPCKAVVSCPSQVMNKPGSPEVDEEAMRSDEQLLAGAVIVYSPLITAVQAANCKLR
jgi:hypothetical protein